MESRSVGSGFEFNAMKDIRIAAVISNSPAGNTEANLERTIRWVKKAKEKKAAIVCFPELNITGYGMGDAIKSKAEQIPGRSSRALIKLAEQKNIVILAGMAEKDAQGRIYASHLVIKPGKDIRVYRKLHIAPPERSLLTQGQTIPLFKACGIKFGIQLCYDAHFPELSTHMAANGVDLVFIPHASPRGTPGEKFKSWIKHLAARAYDNGIFIIACNQAGENNEGLNFPGLALVIGPDGTILKKKLVQKEGMMVENLKADDLDHVRSHKMRYFLPNRRPNLYSKLPPV